MAAASKNSSRGLFEYVYLARPDSEINGISVYGVRLEMGKRLAESIQQKYPEWMDEIDVIVPVPDSSIYAAVGLSEKLGKAFVQALVKNRYVGRTFIMSQQTTRRQAVKQKLNVISEAVRGKNLLLVDDSIVRGNTSKHIVQLVKEAGANKVFFASAAPEVRFTNHYGIDIPSDNELIANKFPKNHELAEFLGVDGLIFLDLQALKDSVQAHNFTLDRFETSVFDGVYSAGKAISLERVSS